MCMHTHVLYVKERRKEEKNRKGKESSSFFRSINLGQQKHIHMFFFYFSLFYGLFLYHQPVLCLFNIFL